MTDRAREACEHCGLPVRDDNGPVELDGKRHDWMRCGLRLSAQLAAARAATAEAVARASREALSIVEGLVNAVDAVRIAETSGDYGYTPSQWGTLLAELDHVQRELRTSTPAAAPAPVQAEADAGTLRRPPRRTRRAGEEGWAVTYSPSPAPPAARRPRED